MLVLTIGSQRAEPKCVIFTNGLRLGIVPIFARITAHFAKAAHIKGTRLLFFGCPSFFRFGVPKLTRGFVVAKPVVVEKTANGNSILVVLVQVLAVFSFLALVLHPEHTDIFFAFGFVDLTRDRFK